MSEELSMNTSWQCVVLWQNTLERHQNSCAPGWWVPVCTRLAIPIPSTHSVKMRTPRWQRSMERHAEISSPSSTLVCAFILLLSSLHSSGAQHWTHPKIKNLFCDVCKNNLIWMFHWYELVEYHGHHGQMFVLCVQVFFCIVMHSLCPLSLEQLHYVLWRYSWWSEEMEAGENLAADATGDYQLLSAPPLGHWHIWQYHMCNAFITDLAVLPASLVIVCVLMEEQRRQ